MNSTADNAHSENGLSRNGSEAEVTIIPARRRKIILDILGEKGVVRVTELSEALGVTEMTIRRDLALLEEQGGLERTHGGAIAADKKTNEPQYYSMFWEQKMKLHSSEKLEIASYATSLIRKADTLFVNSGTTTMEFLKMLDIELVKVISNNPLAPIVSLSEKITVISTGGELRRESFSFVGESATDMVSRIFASKSVIGGDGVSVQFGVTSPSQSEASLTRQMIKNTQGKVILLADSSKIGKVSNFQVAPIDDIDILVTDEGIEEADKTELEGRGVTVIVVQPDEKS